MLMLMLLLLAFQSKYHGRVNYGVFYQEHYLGLYLHMGSRRGWIFDSMVIMMMLMKITTMIMMEMMEMTTIV